jgi:hypothetical protein
MLRIRGPEANPFTSAAHRLALPAAFRLRFHADGQSEALMPHPEMSSDRRASRFAASSPAEAWLMSCSMAGATLALNVLLRWLFS